MYCPYCGSELIIHPVVEPKDINWDLEGDALNEDILRYKRERENWDTSQYVNCTNAKCSMHEKDGTGYMKLHHPFDTTRERGDDSWSISYIN